MSSIDLDKTNDHAAADDASPDPPPRRRARRAKPEDPAGAPGGGGDAPLAPKSLDERLEEVVATYGPSAPYVWDVFRCAHGSRKKIMKVESPEGLNIDTAAFARRHGVGTYLRQLRVRGVQGYVASGDIEVTPEYLSSVTIPATREDRLDRLERLVESLAARPAPAPATGHTTGIAGGLSVRDLIDLVSHRAAPPPQPPADPMQLIDVALRLSDRLSGRGQSAMDEIDRIERIARRIYKRQDEGDGGIGAVLPHVVEWLKPSAPLPGPGSTTAEPPAPASPPRPREPWPGAESVALFAAQLASRVPVLDEEGVGQAADAVAELIEAACGDTALVASRYQGDDGPARMAHDLLHLAPALEPRRADLVRVATRFLSEACEEEGE